MAYRLAYLPAGYDEPVVEESTPHQRHRCGGGIGCVLCGAVASLTSLTLATSLLCYVMEVVQTESCF